MHTEILTANQTELLPLVKKFSKQYFLVGGTAIALYMGHRRSIDFDLFTFSGVKVKGIKYTLAKEGVDYGVIHEESDQLHIIVKKVKITFFYYPYPVKHPVRFENIISMPALIDLAAMKAFALGGRAKWKDYVDIYFLLKDHFSIQEIESKAEKLFHTAFNAKLFRQQLAWYDDIDYSEEVEFIKEDPGKEEIKRFLTGVATTAL